jgi:aspartate racemase
MSKDVFGILGGMGPAAGIDFCNNLVNLNNATRDQEHVQFILFNITDIPDRPTAIINKNTLPVLIEIEKIIRNMEKCGITKIVLACNTVHYLIKEIQDMTKIPVLDMIKCTAEYIKNNKFKLVGLLGTDITTKMNLYSKYIEVLLPDDNFQKKIMSGIYDIKGSNLSLGRAKLMQGIDHLVDSGADSILLGCTELPLILNQSSSIGVTLINPAEVLARKIINEHNSSF